MKVYLNRRYHFSSSHRLHVDSLSTETNQSVFGKCNNPFGHGHNYAVQVTFSGTPDPHTGMILNLADLDAFAQEHLLAPLDFANLNTLDLFSRDVPTTENLATALHRIFLNFAGAHLDSVHVEETSNNAFHFAGEELPRAGRY